eukprot:5713597-Alexandrium_andersonii.AAC.1
MAHLDRQRSRETETDAETDAGRDNPRHRNEQSLAEAGQTDRPDKLPKRKSEGGEAESKQARPRRMRPRSPGPTSREQAPPPLNIN